MHLRRRCSAACLLALLAAAFTAPTQAQNAIPDQPDWVEAEAPPAPAFDASKLISVDVDAQGSLRYGVDPATLSIGKDGIVRYVMVARSTGGAMTAMYEGLRCGTAEYKLYARYNDSRWAPVTTPQWRSLYESARIKYPLALAKQGGCDNKAPPTSVSDLVRQLKNPAPTVYPN